ncbi:aminofutalosine synthase MqnE [Thermosulfuriphilus sp.]
MTEKIPLLAERAALRAGLGDILEKVIKGERLSFQDGQRLFETTDLLALGYLAGVARRRHSGQKVYYIYNQHLNYSNVCVNLCKFCAFGRPKDDSRAYEMSLKEIEAKVRARLSEPIREIHVVGGCHPDLPYEYYLELIRRLKAIRPEVQVKAFSCVEIDHLARISGKDITQVLEELKEAGLSCLPGGGAEIFSPRVRRLLCEKKISGQRWLEISKAAHRQGIPTNATMLYGHIETIEERLDHLLALREAQDETGGFLCFIPLPFKPQKTPLKVASTTGIEDLRMIAVSRLMLDNFPHIKAYWIFLGLKLAQVALAFGADDFHGTVIEERISELSGVEDDKVLTRDEIERLIREAGFEPVERDSLYNPV